jgi:hypothetical protein
VSAAVEYGDDRVFGDVDGELAVGADASDCPTTVMTPLLEARRCTVTGSSAGRGGGPTDGLLETP